MKSFKQYIEYLIEDRLEFLRKKYKDLKHWERGDTEYAWPPGELFDFFSSCDPTPNHKYLDWILRQYIKQDFRREDGNRVVHTLEEFERYKAHLAQKDINQYHHLSDLEDAIGAVNGAKSKRQEIKAIKHDGADKIFDRGGVTVYKIKTEAAAKFYGAGTKWCTAADVNCRFNYYNKRGPLYIVFCKDLDGDPAKYQFHFESNQFMDEKDRSVNLSFLVKRNPSLQDVPAFQGKKVELTDTKNLDKWLIDFMKKEAGIDQLFQDPRINSEHLHRMFEKIYPIRHDKDNGSRFRSSHFDVEYLREKILNHTAVDNVLLKKAIDLDVDRVARIRAAQHIGLDADGFQKLLKDPDDEVKSALTRNPRTPINVLEQLQKDSESYVRYSVIAYAKDRLTHQMYMTAAKDSQRYIRSQVAESCSTPKDILEYIMHNDPDDHLRWVAQTSLREQERRKN